MVDFGAMDCRIKSLLTYWISPTKSARVFLEEDFGHKFALIITCYFGIVQILPLYSRTQSYGTLVLIGGIFGALFCLYFISLFLRVVARLFKSNPSPRGLRIVIGLSLLPWALIFRWAWYMSNGGEQAAQIQHYFPELFCGLIYGYVILLSGLTVALSLNYWKTFFCLTITFIGSLFPLTLLAQCIDYLVQRYI